MNRGQTIFGYSFDMEFSTIRLDFYVNYIFKVDFINSKRRN